MNYRKLWKNVFGEIPKDENGISFEIHHKDGNHENNELSNLMCVSISEHFFIHLSQGDFPAAARILSKIKTIYQNLETFNLTPSDLAQYMVKNKIGVWSVESKNKALETKRKKQVGFCYNFDYQSAGGKIGGPVGIKITHNGTGIYSKQHQSIAGKIGGSKSGKLNLGKPKPKIICPHCGKIGGGQALMNRWHFDNCKSLF